MAFFQCEVHTFPVLSNSLTGRGFYSSVIRRNVETDRLKGNLSVTYVTLVPRRRKLRLYIPSPHLLCPAGAARSPAWILSENLKMRCTCCSLYVCAAIQRSRCNYLMPMCIGSWRDSYSSVIWRDVSVPSFGGTRVTYVTEMFSSSSGSEFKQVLLRGLRSYSLSLKLLLRTLLIKM